MWLCLVKITGKIGRLVKINSLTGGMLIRVDIPEKRAKCYPFLDRLEN